MKKELLAIIAGTLYLIMFHLSPYMGISYVMINIIFMCSPLVIISMVYVVLKYGKPSKHTFEDRFYDDWDYKRNVIEKRELN